MNLSLKVTLNKLYSNVVIVAIPLPKCGNLLILLFFILEHEFLTKVNRNVTVSIDFILAGNGNSSNIFLGSTSCHQHHFKLLFSMKFLCPHCEYEATMKENLQAHMKSIHESHKFTCPQCEYETMMSIADTSYRAP